MSEQKMSDPTALNLFMGDGETENEFDSRPAFTTTAQACWQPGYKVFGGEDHTKFFPLKTGSSTDERQAVYKAASAYIEENGLVNAKGNARKPMKGIQLTVKGDDVPSHPEGRFEWGDSTEFISQVFEPENIQIVSNAIAEFPVNVRPLGEKFVWCKIGRVDNDLRTAKGEMKEITLKLENGEPKMNEDGSEAKMQVPWQFQVPLAVYGNREEAIADMDSRLESNSGIALSETATQNEYTAASLLQSAATINADIKALVSGQKASLAAKAFDPMSAEDAISKVAELWMIEAGDVMQLEGK